MGNNEAITIMKWMCEWFKTIDCMWIKCKCVHILYFLLISREQIKVDFAPTKSFAIKSTKLKGEFANNSWIIKPILTRKYHLLQIGYL